MNADQSTGSTSPAGATAPLGPPTGSRFWQRKRNAILVRELRQNARLGYLPWVLMSLVLLVTFLLAGIGGLAAEAAAPGDIGHGMFQGFFSLAVFVVSLAGPTIAANAVASEREGRTWEALILSGLTAREVARGKFLAAFSSVAIYILAMAPIGALSFLFGGVSAGEVLLGFLFLFAFAAVSVCFGLAISSVMKSTRSALVATLMLSAILIGPLYSFFGMGGSFVAHAAWPAVKEGAMIWYPMALTRGEFGLRYVVLLIALPAVLLGVPGWLLYEHTAANVADVASDRSTGIKHWFLVSTVAMTALCSALPYLPNIGRGRIVVAVGVQIGLSAFLTYAAFLLAGEPILASRRVRAGWERAGASFITRLLGPNLINTSRVIVSVGILTFVAVSAAGAFAVRKEESWEPAAILAFAVYAIPFFAFIAGLLAWLRSRGSTPWIARLITAGVIVVVSVAPWVVASVVGFAQGGKDIALFFAGPSPFYVIPLILAANPSEMHSERALVLGVGISWSTIYLIIGTLLMFAANRRARAYSAAMLDREQRETLHYEGQGHSHGAT